MSTVKQDRKPAVTVGGSLIEMPLHDVDAGLPWAIYARLSQAVDGNMEKVDWQVRLCVQHAITRGLPVAVDHVYVDNSLSAWKRGVKRPDWDRMMAAAEGGEIAGILVWAVDRFTRRPKDLESLIEHAEDHALAIEGPRSGRLDLTSATGRQQARWMALQAASESDNTSERVRAALKRRTAHGQPLGRRAYGWEPNGRVQRPQEVAVLREAAARLLGGESAIMVAAWANSAGHPAPQGGKWRPKQLIDVLSRERHGGHVVHKGKIVSKISNPDGSPQEPIFDADTYEELQSFLASRRRGRTASDEYWLSGMIICGDCGITMTGRQAYRKKANGEPYRVRHYNCHPLKDGCNRYASAHLVERAVDRHMIGRMSDPTNAETIMRQQAKLMDQRVDLQATVDRLDDQLTDLEVKLATDEITPRAYSAAQPKLMTRLRKLRAELEAMEPAAMIENIDAAADWGDFTPDEKRRLVRAYGLKIEVLPYVARGVSRVKITV